MRLIGKRLIATVVVIIHFPVLFVLAIVVGLSQVWNFGVPGGWDTLFPLYQKANEWANPIDKESA